MTQETTGAATTYYQYDRCGNTTVQQAPGGTTYYHWDHENLLKQLDLPGDVHNYFGYDADPVPWETGPRSQWRRTSGARV